MNDFPIQKEFSFLSAKDRKALVRYDLYLQRKNAPLTRLNKLRQLRRFLLFLPPSKRGNLADIAPADIDAFIQWGQDQGYAPGTINVYLSTLYDCFGYFREDDALLRNPVKPRQHYLPVPLRLPRPMERTDIKQLFSVVERSQDRAIFLVALCCGLRVSEVAHLKLSDLDFERHTLRVNHGKGGVDRVVYLTPEVEESLRVWLSERISSSSNGYLFCSPKSRNQTQPVSRSHLWRLLKGYLQKAGIDPAQYSFHTLRHTFATELLNAGISLRSLQELLGHKSLQEVLIYAKLYESTKREEYYHAMKKIPAVRSLVQVGGGGRGRKRKGEGL